MPAFVCSFENVSVVGKDQDTQDETEFLQFVHHMQIIMGFIYLPATK